MSAALILAAATIFVNPGQCIFVGTQQVCALDAAAAVSSEPDNVLYVCRYGMHEGSEVAGIKSYAVVQVAIKSNGAKLETPVKNYGQNAKDACEKDAEKRTAAVPAANKR